MSKHDASEILNGSSNSIIIKEDSKLDITPPQTDNEEVDTYDLEVQKPSERAKIINDSSFFKKLSIQFYAEKVRNSKSLAVLPKHYYL